MDMAQSFIGDEFRSRAVSLAVSNFYYNIVANSCQSSPLVRKTLSVLTGLWEQRFTTSRSSSPRHHSHISTYSQAVTELRTSSKELSPDIVLIASILFANCEYLMDDLSLAYQHLRAGARILREHRDFEDTRLPPQLLETLGTIFEAFDHSGFELDCSTPGSEHTDSTRESPFEDLNHANNDLLNIYSHTFALNKVAHNHPECIMPAAHDFQRWATTWKCRATALQESVEVENMPWLGLLQGQHTAVNNMLMDMTSVTQIPRTDQETLDEMILQVSTFLQCFSPSLQTQAATKRPFQGNAGLILPLFMVILQCPDGEICETALSLLSRLRVTEGAWNSCCAASVARSILNSRYATKFETAYTSYALQDILPTAQIKIAKPLESRTEIDLTVVFQHHDMLVPNESNTIIGGFCLNNSTQVQPICGVIEACGFQGPVVTATLEGCFCHDGV